MGSLNKLGNSKRVQEMSGREKCKSRVIRFGRLLCIRLYNYLSVGHKCFKHLFDSMSVPHYKTYVYYAACC